MLGTLYGLESNKSNLHRQQSAEDVYGVICNIQTVAKRALDSKIEKHTPYLYLPVMSNTNT